MKRIYLATIQIAIQGVESEAEACDCITAMLSENLMQQPDTGLLDWEYLSIGAQKLSPTDHYIPNSPYVEGMAFS